MALSGIMVVMTKVKNYPLSESEFEEIYSRVPKATVELVVVAEDGVLLVKRSHKSWQGKWHIPGGTVFYGEKMTDTVNRVAKNELGVEVEVERCLGVVNYESEKKERGFGWSVAINLLCITRSQVPERNVDGEEVKAFKQMPENVIEEQKPVLAKILAHADILKQ